MKKLFFFLIRKLNERKNRLIHEDLNQHNKGIVVKITQQAIDKVKYVYPNGYEKIDVENTLKRRKKLLEYSMKFNNSYEVACVMNIKENSFTDFIKGTKDTVDFLGNVDAYHLISSSQPRTLELMHNHPALSYFSLNDINVFMNYPTIKVMTIVTNQGKTWYINKLDAFDLHKAQFVMAELLKKHVGDEDKIIEKFLKRSYDYSVERN